MPPQIQAGYKDYERLSVLIPFHLDLCPLQPQNASAFSLNQAEVDLTIMVHIPLYQGQSPLFS